MASSRVGKPFSCNLLMMLNVMVEIWNPLKFERRCSRNRIPAPEKNEHTHELMLLLPFDLTVFWGRCVTVCLQCLWRWWDPKGFRITPPSIIQGSSDFQATSRSICVTPQCVTPLERQQYEDQEVRSVKLKKDKKPYHMTMILRFLSEWERKGPKIVSYDFFYCLCFCLPTNQLVTQSWWWWSMLSDRFQLIQIKSTFVSLPSS